MALSNYRSFADKQTVELRKITCLFGRNNSGKSALTRAPLVIATGMNTDSSIPLDLDLLEDDIVGSFLDLIHGHRPHGSLGIEFDLSDGTSDKIKLAARIQNIDEYHTQVVSHLALTQGDAEFTFTWEGTSSPENASLYSISRPDSLSTYEATVAFQGILPTNIDAAHLPEAEKIRLINMADQTRIQFDKIRYIGPFRERPLRFYRPPARMPDFVGKSGENTAGILTNDLRRNRGGLIDFINEYFESTLPGWSINAIDNGGLATIVLQSRTDPSLQVNLVDTGTGIAQALPIFVQRALDIYQPPSSPVLEVVEQPELHLHPAAHGTLADLYLDAINKTTTRFIVETHSETFLLRLRRRVAEGKASPDDLAIYFIDSANGSSTARRINIDAAGNLDFWPPGVFSEDYEETRHLAQAQLARIKQG